MYQGPVRWLEYKAVAALACSWPEDGADAVAAAQFSSAQLQVAFCTTAGLPGKLAIQPAAPRHVCRSHLWLMQGIAYVEFSSDAGLQAAIAMDGQEVQGHKLSVARSAPPGGARGGRGPPGRGAQGQQGQDQGRGRSRGGRGDFRGRGRGPGRGRGDEGSAFEARTVEGGRGRLGQGPRGAGRRGRSGRSAGGRARSNDDFRSMMLGGR